MKNGMSKKYFDNDILRSQLISAQKFLREKKYAEALDISENLLNASKPMPVIFILRGDALAGLDKYQEAIESYSKCLNVQVLKLSALLKIAANYRNIDRSDKAIENYRQAFNLDPNNAGILNSIGNVYRELSKFSKALVYYERALKLDPNHVGAKYNKGTTLSQTGKQKKSIKIFEQILSKDKNHFYSLRALGRAYSKLDEYKHSLNYYIKALKLKSQDIPLMNELVEIHNKLGNYQRSKKILEFALEMRPDDHRTLNNLANVYGHLDNHELSIKTYEKAINLDPQNDNYITNLGVVVAKNKSYKKAIKIYENALRINPSNLATHVNLGVAYLNTGDPEEAIKEFKIAIELDDLNTEPYYGLAKASLDLQKNEDSIRNFRKALNINPSHARSLNGLAYPLIKTYKFAEGWKHYEYRWIIEPAKSSKKPIVNRAMWNGELNKRVILWREQGIGDDILFLSLVLEASKITNSMTVYTQERLLSLCRRGMPTVTFKPIKAKIENEEFDYHLPMGSLPRLFRTSEKDFENTVCGYLKADEKRIKILREELGIRGKKIIGISWTSFKGSNMDNKNFNLNLLSEVFKDLNVVLLNLQYGEVDKEIREFTNATGIEILQCKSVDNREDLDGLAALIEICDLVVSTSNVTIHLAGALGKEAWVLLPYAAHFWWMVDRDDSLWYPTVKCYRQKKFQDWGNIPLELGRDLRDRF